MASLLRCIMPVFLALIAVILMSILLFIVDFSLSPVGNVAVGSSVALGTSADSGSKYLQTGSSYLGYGALKLSAELELAYSSMWSKTNVSNVTNETHTLGISKERVAVVDAKPAEPTDSTLRRSQSATQSSRTSIEPVTISSSQQDTFTERKSIVSENHSSSSSSSLSSPPSPFSSSSSSATTDHPIDKELTKVHKKGEIDSLSKNAITSTAQILAPLVKRYLHNNTSVVNFEKSQQLDSTALGIIFENMYSESEKTEPKLEDSTHTSVVTHVKTTEGEDALTPNLVLRDQSLVGVGRQSELEGTVKRIGKDNQTPPTLTPTQDLEIRTFENTAYNKRKNASIILKKKKQNSLHSEGEGTATAEAETISKMEDDEREYDEEEEDEEEEDYGEGGEYEEDDEEMDVNIHEVFQSEQEINYSPELTSTLTEPNSPQLSSDFITNDLMKIASNTNFHMPYNRVYRPIQELLKEIWLKPLLRILSQLDGKQVTLVVANSKYTEVLLNWLISATVLCDPPLKHIIVICLDRGLHQLLGARRIPAVFAPYSSMLSQKYKFRRYFELIMMMRLGFMRIINRFGFDCAMYDIDAIILKNPQPLYDDKYNDADIIGSRGSLPHALVRKWHVTICIGAVFIRSNSKTEDYWYSVATAKLRASDSVNDQIRLNYGLEGITWMANGYDKNKLTIPAIGYRKNLKVVVLPFNVVCRYECSVRNRWKYYIWHKGGSRTNESKREGAKKGHTWFLNVGWQKLRPRVPGSNEEVKGRDWLKLISTE